MDVFLAGDDIKSKKPNPEIYVAAAKKLGLDPAECLVVEDSSIGLEVGYPTTCMSLVKCIVVHGYCWVGQVRKR